MDQSPRCKHYNAKDPEVKENCSNCTKWIGALCLDHLMRLKECEIKQKFEALDYDD
ncbi:MAG: hypothetical protein P4L69_01475 [Desulfosporosinus sp.]|nr:hypothetical protein [Desulfosporosinus sp.]